jgi:sugar phosphate permease
LKPYAGKGSYALIPHFVELKLTGLASGTVSGMGFLGSLATTWLVGVMLDAAWGYSAGYWLLTAFAVLGLASALLLRLSPRREGTSET